MNFFYYFIGASVLAGVLLIVLIVVVAVRQCKSQDHSHVAMYEPLDS